MLLLIHQSSRPCMPLSLLLFLHHLGSHQLALDYFSEALLILRLLIRRRGHEKRLRVVICQG